MSTNQTQPQGLILTQHKDFKIVVQEIIVLQEIIHTTKAATILEADLQEATMAGGDLRGVATVEVDLLEVEGDKLMKRFYSISQKNISDLYQ